MKCKIFTLAALAALALPASADTLDLSLADLGSGWDSSYDAATKTITFDGAWTGRGWWLGEADYSQWDQVVVECEPCACYVQIVVEYNAEGVESTTSGVNAGAEKIACELNAEAKNSVKQIYIQSAEAGTLTLKAAYLENGVTVDPNLLWEGEYTIAGWNNGAKFSASKVAVGDLLEYTFTNAGESNSQVLLKGNDWNNLLGTGKINNADMALGKVQVGVTQEMLDNCGGDIFVQGEGNCVLTKVEKVGTFAAERVLCYGARVLGTSAFITIPEDATQLEVEFSAKPEWAQICNTSWADFELQFTESEDGTVRTYTLTPEAIASINEKKEVVINGSGISVVKIAIPTGTGVNAINAAASNGKYYNLQGVEVSNPTLPGLYIHNGKKILVK